MRYSRSSIRKFQICCNPIPADRWATVYEFNRLSRGVWFDKWQIEWQCLRRSVNTRKVFHVRFFNFGHLGCQNSLPTQECHFSLNFNSIHLLPRNVTLLLPTTDFCCFQPIVNQLWTNYLLSLLLAQKLNILPPDIAKFQNS